MNIEQHIQHYKDTIAISDNVTRQLTSELKKKELALKEHIQRYEQRNLFVKIGLLFSYSIVKQTIVDEIEDLQKQLSKGPDKNTTALKLLVLESARELMATGNSADKLEAIEREHLMLKELYSMARQTEKSGQRAFEEIRLAIKSLSDAETIEVLDAVTSNKFISTVSTAQNFSASDATSKANQALNDFQKKLNAQQVFFQEVKHNLVIETIDFAIDMMGSDGPLDFWGSLFSLITLTNTKEKLGELLEQLTPILKEVSVDCTAQAEKLKIHEQKLLEFKTSSREMVIPILQSHGITVSKNFVSSISELYAPSVERA